MALCFYNISPAVLDKVGWYIKNSWYKKFLILSFSFFSKPSIFWKRILAVGDRLWVWWLALFLELGWHVIVWCHIEILALCDKNTKRRLHSSWLKKIGCYRTQKKSKILLARATPWPGQWPGDEMGNDRTII